MESLEQINPSQVRNFFVSLCSVSSRYEKKHHNIEDLNKQLEKIKKYSKGKLDTGDIPGLKSKINEVLESERKILGHNRAETAKEKELFEKIGELEHELQLAKQERDNAIEKNRKQIHELNAALLSIKTRMDKFIERKEEREKRIRELEKKINKKSSYRK